MHVYFATQASSGSCFRKLLFVLYNPPTHWIHKPTTCTCSARWEEAKVLFQYACVQPWNPALLPTYYPAATPLNWSKKNVQQLRQCLCCLLTGGISALQFQSVLLACSQHEKFQMDGSRCGFFLGDGQCFVWRFTSELDYEQLLLLPKITWLMFYIIYRTFE